MTTSKKHRAYEIQKAQARRRRRHSKDHVNKLEKDKFIDLAQAALEEATLEEERKGVMQEIIEALIAKSGAPLVLEVISDQLHCQDVIEELAEKGHEQELRRQYSHHSSDGSIPALNSDVLKEEDRKETKVPPPATLNNELLVKFAEYLWRLFRVLLLSSLVGLVYHFLNI
ncbi:hypothetical protein K501DRAFT_255413 [Backusella circina FSU 941]|nr:hypothetical protein K501DRAFT_255413 [Backusella circina FSU 941]